MTLSELLALNDSNVEALADVEINYPQANGLPELRRKHCRHLQRRH